MIGQALQKNPVSFLISLIDWARIFGFHLPEEFYEFESRSPPKEIIGRQPQ